MVPIKIIEAVKHGLHVVVVLKEVSGPDTQLRLQRELNLIGLVIFLVSLFLLQWLRVSYDVHVIDEAEKERDDSDMDQLTVLVARFRVGIHEFCPSQVMDTLLDFFKEKDGIFEEGQHETIVV